MTTIAISIKATSTPVAVESAEDLAVAAAEQIVHFYKVRYNGTTRHLPIHPETSTEAQVAVWCQQMRDQGWTMKHIAKEGLMSVSTVRRRLNSLLLQEDLQDSDTEEVQDLIDAVADLKADAAPVALETEATTAVVA